MSFRAMHSPTSEGLLSLQSTDEEDELQSVTEDDLPSQCSSWSPTEGDVQSQWSQTEEDLEPHLSASKEDEGLLPPQSTDEEDELQPVTEGDVQSQWSQTEDDLEPHLSATKEEQSTAEEGPDAVIPQESFLLINIWNVAALKQTGMGMRARFQWQVPCVITPSSDASYSSSPLLNEYAYGSASANDENNDQHLQPIPFDILDYEYVNFIDSSSLARLVDMIHQLRSVEPYNPQILDKVFAESRAVLDSCLYYHFTSAGLSIDKWTCMEAPEFTYESANYCVMILKIATRLLCLMYNNLAEAECESFNQDLRDRYFELCARGLVENLIKAADSISNLKWPASHIYQMLVLYKAIADVLRDFKYPSESDRIFQQMQVNFKGIFDCIKCAICEYLNAPQDTIVHKVTDFLVRSMDLFTSHSSTVQDTCIGNSSSSLDHHLCEVINYWAEHLGRHFMSYTEGRNYVFLLNNLTHFDEETRMPPNTLKSLIDTNTEKYLRECWGPVRDYVKLISGVQPRWSSLGAFISEFNIVYQRQKKWVLKTQLKRKLREEIKNFLVPYYDTFLKELQNRAFSKFRLFVWKHTGQQAKYMTTEELQSKVMWMFETEHNVPV